MEKQKIGSFRDLETWQLAMDLVDLVLSHLKEMPEKEWDLKRQMSKAVISIPANVAAPRTRLTVAPVSAPARSKMRLVALVTLSLLLDPESLPA